MKYQILFAVAVALVCTSSAFAQSGTRNAVGSATRFAPVQSAPALGSGTRFESGPTVFAPAQSPVGTVTGPASSVIGSPAYSSSPIISSSPAYSSSPVISSAPYSSGCSSCSGQSSPAISYSAPIYSSTPVYRRSAYRQPVRFFSSRSFAPVRRSGCGGCGCR